VYDLGGCFTYGAITATRPQLLAALARADESAVYLLDGVALQQADFPYAGTLDPATSLVRFPCD
jgi:hypothetical protein